jgi:class 3 adenylate cyclase
MQDRSPLSQRRLLQRTAGPYIWVNRYTFTVSARLPLRPQLPTCRCVALSDARGHEETYTNAHCGLADVVGYSRLAGTDEDRTLARLRALRSDLIDPTIAVHHGRVVKRTGDGVLIEFRSVVDAVSCAIEVQNGMAERNAGLPPERRIEFRVGIHLGDVVEESDGDLMGDGVNIAARLEGIAKPGAICLSEQAYWQVKSRLDLAVSDLGSTELKNIAEPVRVYSLQVGVPAQTKPATTEAKAPEPKRRSVLTPLAAGIGRNHRDCGRHMVLSRHEPTFGRLDEHNTAGRGPTSFHCGIALRQSLG